MICRHCQHRAGVRPKRLCNHCYMIPWIRGRYASGNKRSSRPYGTGKKARSLPPTPTSFQPGTKEKISVLADRVRRGFQLWHPQDGQAPAVDDLRGYRKTHYCPAQNKAG